MSCTSLRKLILLASIEELSRSKGIVDSHYLCNLSPRLSFSGITFGNISKEAIQIMMQNPRNFFPWKRFFLAVGAIFLMLQIVVLGDMLYMYGSQFQQSSRIHNLKLLYVDYDNDVVGKSVMDAYDILRSDSFPTVQQVLETDYPNPADVRKAVCQGDYWGAIYAKPGASENLAVSLNGDGNNSNRTELCYIWNGARYSSIAASAIRSNILALIQATRSMYYKNNASAVITSAPLNSNPDALNAFLDPIQATEINIKTTEQGPRTLYNTVTLLIIILPQFFFVMALNGISAKFEFNSRVGVLPDIVFRMCMSLIYTFIGGLAMIGFIWAFRESWNVQGSQFMLSWMVIWLAMHISYLFYDITTACLPLIFVPVIVLTTILISISSTISPFELSAGFYRWGYALPGHELYQVLVQIWTDGCDNHLYRALPILFSWWIVFLVIAPAAMRYRVLQAHRETATSNQKEGTGNEANS